MPDYEDSPVIMMKTNYIRKIEYKNGYTDLMGFQNPRKNRPLGISAGYAASTYRRWRSVFWQRLIISLYHRLILR